jgi:hypothetical protein
MTDPTTPTERAWDWDDGPDWKQIRKNHGLPPGSESAIIDIWYEAAAAHKADAENWRGLLEDVRVHMERTGMSVSLVEHVARQVAIGAAVERLGQDRDFDLIYMADDPNDVPPFMAGWLVTISKGRYDNGTRRPRITGEADHLPEAIAAALEDDRD